MCVFMCTFIAEVVIKINWHGLYGPSNNPVESEVPQFLFFFNNA